jgi:tetratricopeptide (TPR) repeat protein
MNGVRNRGSLNEQPLPELLLDLAAAGTTGRLRIRAGGEQAEVHLASGRPVRCDLPGDAPGIIELLVERGELTEAAAERTRSTARAKGCSPEQALLGLKLLGPRELVDALRAVVSRRLVALGRHDTGDYELDATATTPEGAAALRADPVPIAQEIVETRWRPDRMLNDLEEWSQGPLRLTERGAGIAERLARRSGVSDLLAGLDGSRSVWSLLGSASAAGPIAALWVLARTGALEIAPELSDAGAERPQEEAMQPAEATAPSEPAEIEIVLSGRSSATEPAKGAGAASVISEGPGAEDDEASALRADIQGKHERLGTIDHYELLGIERDADAPQIKRAYLKAAKRFHPDALARLGLVELKGTAGALFTQIAKAQAILGNAASRADYDAALAGHREIDADRVAQAEILFRKGEMLMRAGNFRGAVDYVEASTELWPEDPAYHAALGWCLYKNHPADEARAREHLERAIALDETFAQTHMRLAIVLKTLGDHDAAARHTKRAKEIDPGAKA